VAKRKVMSVEASIYQCIYLVYPQSVGQCRLWFKVYDGLKYKRWIKHV